MSTYEEMVVDRSVDAAWLQFRVLLADHLAQMDEDDELLLSAPGTRSLKKVRIRFSVLAEDCVEARFLLAVGSSYRLGIRDSSWARLQDLGVVRSDGIRLAVETRRVDELANVAFVLFHDELGVIHPSFVEVELGDLVLVDPPKELVSASVVPELPESVTVQSQEELIGWVDRALEPEFGHTPRKTKQGDIWVKRGNHRLVIRVSKDRPIIDLSAVIAKDVDIRKARKQVHNLNDRFYFYRFFVRGDRLMMAATVSGRPFAPQHLVETMNMMLSWLSKRAPELQAKVSAESAQDVDANVDADLMLLYATPTAALARALSKNDRQVLSDWRTKVRLAQHGAKQQAAQLEHGPVQSALVDSVIAWRRVNAAIREVLLNRGAAA